MKYRNTFIQSHDIDLIFKVNDIVIHAASNGMPIMDAVNDVEINRDNFEKIYTLPDIIDDEGVEINDGYLRDIWGFYLRTTYNCLRIMIHFVLTTYHHL